MSSVTVQSGEIISSNLMNSILERLGVIEGKVANLDPVEPISLVQITGFDPPLQVEEEKNLVIHGTNFLYPPERNTVSFDTKKAGTILDGSSCRLNVTVPKMSLPSGGKNATVTVENDLGNAKADYKILREKPPVGDPPEIKSVTDLEGKLTLVLGEPALIVGKNFADRWNQNNVKIVTKPLGEVPIRGEIEYPSRGSLEINEEHTRPPEKLAVNLPTIRDIVGGAPPANLPDKVKVRFKVTVGDHRPARSDEVEVKIK